MKRLLTVIVVAALGWSAYWFIGSTGVKTGFSAWFEQRRTEGWLAEFTDISVSGFPNRFDATLTDVALADPDTGVAWEAPFLQVFALSYKPNHVIAIWPNKQTLAYPDQRIGLSSKDMKASLVTGASASLPLERLNLAVEDLQMASDADWQLSAQSLNLALLNQPDKENTYRLAMKSVGLAPPVAFKLGGKPDLPNTLRTVEADVQVTFTAPLDRHVIETARPQPVWIDLSRVQIAWGDLELEAAGKVDVDAKGNPNGDITIRATNWREIVQLARASGQVSDGLLDGIEQGLELLAGLSGNPKTLDIPLSLGGGVVRIGPVPIVEAPRLILR